MILIFRNYNEIANSFRRQCSWKILNWSAVVGLSFFCPMVALIDLLHQLRKIKMLELDLILLDLTTKWYSLSVVDFESK